MEQKLNYNLLPRNVCFLFSTLSIRFGGIVRKGSRWSVPVGPIVDGVFWLGVDRRLAPSSAPGAKLDLRWDSTFVDLAMEGRLAQTMSCFDGCALCFWGRQRSANFAAHVQLDGRPNNFSDFSLTDQ